MLFFLKLGGYRILMKTSFTAILMAASVAEAHSIESVADAGSIWHMLASFHHGSPILMIGGVTVAIAAAVKLGRTLNK